MLPIIDEEIVDLSLEVNSKEEVLKYFSDVLFKQNRINNAELFFHDLQEREKIAPTYIGYDIAIPHAKSEAVIRQSVVFARLNNEIIWDEENNKVKLVFMLVVPKNASKEHLALLASLARALTKEEFRNKLLQSDSKQSVLESINNVLEPQHSNNNQQNPVNTAKESNTTTESNTVNVAKKHNQPLEDVNKVYDIVAVTACSVGVAHTYISAENLIKAANQMGVKIKVQTNGSIGIKNQLTTEDIKNAKAVIIASDIEVDQTPFVGKPKITTTAKDAVYNAERLIDRALSLKPLSENSAEANSVVTKTRANNNSNSMADSKGIGVEFYKNLMSGVSYMLPFIVMGGVFIALAIALSGGITAGVGAVIDNKFLKAMSDVGAIAFTFVPPVLAAYIAFSIAGRPGLAPGMIGGAIAGVTGAGFLGGLIAGFIAGYIVKWLLKVPVGKSIETVVPILLIPTIAGGLVAIIMSFIGLPIASLMKNLTAGLAFLQQSSGSAIFLYLLLGLMVAFDMGGPINKVAFLFGSAMIAEGNPTIMGAISAAIPIPPLAMGLATLLDKKMYSNEEKAAGKAGLFLGMVGITEGAIPFAAADPFRVIPSIMVGSGVAALIAGIFRVADYAPHGGPIVLPVVSGKIAWIIAVIVGLIVTNIMIYTLKRIKFTKTYS